MLDVPSKAAEQTTQTEKGVGVQQTSLAAEDVAQFAIERLEGGKGEEVRGRDPAGQVESFQVAADGPTAGGDNDLISRREKYLPTIMINQLQHLFALLATPSPIL